MTDLTKTSIYKAFEKRQQFIKIWKHDDNHLHTDETYTIMYSGISNVTNPADALLTDSPDQIS